MGSRPAYCSREALALALDRALNVYSIEGLDRAIHSATDVIEQAFERRFYPYHGTWYFDVPADDTSTSTPSWKLYTDPVDFISVDSATVGGSAVSGIQLRPDNRTDRPASWLELDRAGATTFRDGTSGTPQRRAAIVGTTGWWDEAKACGALASTLAIGADTADLVTAPAIGVAQVGVGHLLRVGSERLVVDDRLLVDTGENLGADLVSQVSASIPTSITVGDGTDYAAGEMITVGGEVMLIQRVLSNTLFVRRGYAGTPVASHATGTDIYAYRRLLVTRGVAGTTAAEHAGADPVTRWVPPYAIEALAVAIAQETAVQEGAAYARTVGSDDNEREARASGLAAAWKRAKPYSRKGARTYAV
ncbi:MAG: hypothetical protein V4515_14405 [Chloroflexota bacterium]